MHGGQITTKTNNQTTARRRLSRSPRSSPVGCGFTPALHVNTENPRLNLWLDSAAVGVHSDTFYPGKHAPTPPESETKEPTPPCSQQQLVRGYRGLIFLNAYTYMTSQVFAKNRPRKSGIGTQINSQDSSYTKSCFEFHDRKTGGRC